MLYDLRRMNGCVTAVERLAVFSVSLVPDSNNANFTFLIILLGINIAILN
jgi:hypothetical protein